MADLFSDPKLNFASSTENEIRATYPFANLYLSFPTKPYDDNDIYFPAYLRKIQDNVTPEYSATHVFGRSDPVATYKKTNRKISVDFDIPAFNEFDANEILKKLNILLQNLYPGYLEVQGQSILNSPPLMRMKFANLICNPFMSFQGLLGYSESVSINHNFENVGNFIVPFGNDGYVFAKAYTLSINFNVLHEEVVGWDDKNKKFKADNYPYNLISAETIPTIAKVGTFSSNLRGSVTQNPAVAKGLTLVLGV